MRPALLSLLLAIVLIGGCTTRVTPPKVEVEVQRPVVVEVKDTKQSGRFCPPGQAKKGRC